VGTLTDVHLAERKHKGSTSTGTQHEETVHGTCESYSITLGGSVSKEITPAKGQTLQLHTRGCQLAVWPYRSDRASSARHPTARTAQWQKAEEHPHSSQSRQHAASHGFPHPSLPFFLGGKLYPMGRTAARETLLAIGTN